MCFNVALHCGFSMLAGALTLSIMILPLILRTTEEALMAVPDSYREGSFGLGAGKLRTVFRIVLPSAVPGILAGVILAIGRIVGETCGADLYLRHRYGNLSIKNGAFSLAAPRSSLPNPVGPYVCPDERRTLHATRPMPRRWCCWCWCIGINALSRCFAATKRTSRRSSIDGEMDGMEWENLQ